MKEKLAERLEAIKDRRDDMLTIEEIGIDQIIVDEAQEFRKLSFATNRTTLKGVDPDGSQRAWDLYVKTRFIDGKNPRRALIQASGTPITNTLGEMFTLLRFQNEDALRERGVHEFDAWASAFGDTRTELELQPSGTYKPVERFSQFVNVPELIDMFRACADVVLKDDLRDYLTPAAASAAVSRQLITADASDAFRDYQRLLADRIAEIESAHAPHAEGRRHPAQGHHRWPPCRDRHAAGLGGQRQRAGQQAQQADRQRPPHLARRPASTVQRHRDGSAVPDPWRRPDDLLRSRHARGRSRRAASPPIAGSGTSCSASAFRRQRSPSCRTSSAPPTSSACSTTFNAGRVRILHRLDRRRWAPASTCSCA